MTGKMIFDLTARELAKAKKSSLAAVRTWTRQGMPCERCGRLVRYSLELAEGWLSKRGEESLARFRATLAAKKANQQEAA